MPLTQQEQARIRDYLGYLNVSSAASIQLGFPRASQPLFLVQAAMDRVLPEAEDIVRKHLTELDKLESEVSGARRRLKATSVGEITLNAQELNALKKEQRYWAVRLADSLGVPLNAYSERWSSGGPNLRVVHDA